MTESFGMMIEIKMCWMWNIIEAISLWKWCSIKLVLLFFLFLSFVSPDIQWLLWCRILCVLSWLFTCIWLHVNVLRKKNFFFSISFSSFIDVKKVIKLDIVSAKCSCNSTHNIAVRNSFKILWSIVLLLNAVRFMRFTTTPFTNLVESS